MALVAHRIDARWLAALWLVPLGPGLAWTARTLARPEHHPNLLVLLVWAAVAIAVPVWRRRRLPLPRAWTPRPAPLAVALFGLAAFVVLDRTVDISLLSAGASFLALYGVYGLFVSPGRWTRARAGLGLALAALPIAEQAHHYAGFALRVVTARVVAALLSELGAQPVAAETVLVLERGAANVEAACSGLASVWAASLLLFGVAFVARRPLNLRFVLALSVQSILLLAGNIARITALVGLTHHFDLAPLADLIHEPLGVLSFAISGLIGVALLRPQGPAPRRARRLHRGIAAAGPPRRLPRDAAAAGPRRRLPRGIAAAGPPRRLPRDAAAASPRRRLPRGVAAAALLLAPLVALALHDRPPPRPGGLAPIALALPSSVATTVVPMSATERGLFSRHGGAAAEKRKFTFGSLTGEFLLVPARSWRAHHPPELCLIGSGHTLDGPLEVRFSAHVSARHTTVDRGRGTAVHWLQTGTRTTPDLLERIRDGVFGSDRRWVLVSILVHQPRAADDRELGALVVHLHRAIARSWENAP